MYYNVLFAAATAAAKKNEQYGKKGSAAADFFDYVSDAAATAAAKEYYDKQPQVAIIIGKTETVNHDFSPYVFGNLSPSLHVTRLRTIMLPFVVNRIIGCRRLFFFVRSNPVFSAGRKIKRNNSPAVVAIGF